ncbi:MAG: hypothetical protein HC884_19975 [Chloroflexaceae bacterium]|nr:hypothetical protein [Chloroflexaceae bacterium]
MEATRWQVLDVVAQLRTLISELRGDHPEKFGLLAALEGYVTHLPGGGGAAPPQIRLHLDPQGDQFAPPVKWCLYRVAREAVWNALKYAQARTIRLTLEWHPRQGTLWVVDDGCGFCLPAEVQEFAASHRFGLIGIVEQVEGLGGQVMLQSGPGRGTTVGVRLPIAEGTP